MMIKQKYKQDPTEISIIEPNHDIELQTKSVYLERSVNIGAMRKLYDLKYRYNHFFNNNFKASAKGWPNPLYPTKFGPILRA